MSDLSQLLTDLQQEYQRKQREVSRLEVAIKALKGVASGSGAKAGGPVRRRHHLSVAARRRIAAAQRARWAKVRAQKKAA